MEEGKSVFKILRGTPPGNRPLGTPRRRWDLKEILVNTRNWVHSARDRNNWRALVNAALNLRVPCCICMYVLALYPF